MRNSRRAGAFIVLGGAATLALLTLLAIDPLLKCAAVAWVGATMLDALRVVAQRRGRRGVRAVRITAPSAIEVLDGQGTVRNGEVRDGSFVAPWLTIIRWRPDSARFDRTIVVLPDMLDAERFRQLRVLLRWA